jgi:hypothetical protein
MIMVRSSNKKQRSIVEHLDIPLVFSLVVPLRAA